MKTSQRRSRNKTTRAAGLAAGLQRATNHSALAKDACRRYSCDVHDVDRVFVADYHRKPRTKKPARQAAPYWQATRGQRWGGQRR